MSSFHCGLQFRVREGPDRGRAFLLEHRELTVGRARIAGDRAPGWILLNDPLVQRIHAELAWHEQENAYHLISRPDARVEVNGEVVPNGTLLAGDVVKFGDSVLVLQAATAVLSAEPRQAAPVSAVDAGKTIKMTRCSKTLEVLSGVRKGEKLALKGLKIQLGGNNNEPIPHDKQWWDQDVVIQDPGVPFRCMAWHWQEQEKAFEVSMLRSVPVPVSFERSVDGVEWMSEMPSGMGAAVIVRSLDRILMGKTTLQLVIEEF